jgi:dipeptidyl aminopeptidase/acylaminoacyl peptidase
MMAGMRPLLHVALILVGVVGLLVLMSLAQFWVAVRPPRIAVPLHPAEFGLTPEEVTIVAADGAKLAGWFLPRPSAAGIVLLHGYPADKADLLPLAAALHRRFAVLLVDLRHFGKSEGSVTTLGLRERDDLRRALDFLATQGVSPVGVFGLSLGGAVAIMTAAEEPRIRAVVAYAPFADLNQLGHDLYRWLGPLRVPMVALMRLWSRLFLGADLTAGSPAAAARALDIPVLLIHSREDEQIGFAHAERLHRAFAANPRARFHFLERGRHAELPADFTRRVADFFAESLAPGAP